MCYNNFVKKFFWGFLSLTCCFALKSESLFKTMEKVEFFDNEKMSTHAVFFLSDDCSPKVEHESKSGIISLKISFPEADFGPAIDKSKFFAQLNKLNLVDFAGIDFDYKQSSQGVNVKLGVVLTLRFDTKKAYVKFAGIDGKRFRLEIFSKSELKKLSNKIDGPLLLAFNNDEKYLKSHDGVKKKVGLSFVY